MNLAPSDLRNVIVFRHATDDDLQTIAQQGTQRTIEEGEYFFWQGDPATHAYVLLQGKVKLLQANRLGQGVNLRTIYPWQLFGALGAVRNQADYPASAQALEDSAALAVESEFLKHMMESRPYLSMDLMQLMTSYIQELQSRYRELATERIEQRIARALLRLAAQSGQKTTEGIDLLVSRQELSEISGATLHSVSRVLADWNRKGFIDTGREHVRITDPHSLVRIADGLP